MIKKRMIKCPTMREALNIIDVRYDRNFLFFFPKYLVYITTQLQHPKLGETKVERQE